MLTAMCASLQTPLVSSVRFALRKSLGGGKDERLAVSKIFKTSREDIQLLRKQSHQLPFPPRLFDVSPNVAVVVFSD